MSFAIHGIGTANPPDAIGAREGLAIARILGGPDVRTSTWLGPIYDNSTVTRRFQVIGGLVKKDLLDGTSHSNSPFLPTTENDGIGPTTGERMQMYVEEAGPLALRASTAALKDASFEPRTISHLVTISCTGFIAPGIDLALINGLDLRPTVQRTHIGFMGCHGALNGLRVANAFATADSRARVLLVAVELCSLHYYYGNTADKLVANAIFADGAAAVAGSAGHADWSLAASGSCLIPASAEDMGWTVGNHGFEMTLSRRVPGLIARHLRPWLEAWLSDNDLSLDSIGSWAVHPGGPKILDAVEESLPLPSKALATSREIFAHFGNMSSPTVLFVLDRLRRQNAPRPCVALGFGPGLVVEAALFR